jgi:catechol 2,3-dioxygenase-like lactoylglutathione lyase family enzyme
VNVWYRVKDLDAARDFYTRTFGFEQVYLDEEGRWARFVRDGVEIALAEGEFAGGDESGEEEVIATLEVSDLKAEADRLREAGVNVGVVLEIPGAIRLLDVFDPDGNRIQLSEDVDPKA